MFELRCRVDVDADEYSVGRDIFERLIAEVVLVDVVGQHFIEAPRSFVHLMLELVTALNTGHTPRWLIV